MRSWPRERRLGRVHRDDPLLIDRIARVLRDGPALRVAMLFGSAARGQLHADSDVDLGILPVDTDLPLRAELDLQAALAQACGRSVDLVRLDHATTVLKWRVLQEGRAIAPTSHADLVRFTRDSALEYAEFAPALHRAEVAFQAKLRAGATTERGPGNAA